MCNNYTLFGEISTNTNYRNKTEEVSDWAISTQTSQGFPVAGPVWPHYSGFSTLI